MDGSSPPSAVAATAAIEDASATEPVGDAAAADVATQLDDRQQGGEEFGLPADKRVVSDKIMAARHRVLGKKGARIHAAMGPNIARSALAMLDANGVVVSWYDPSYAGGDAADPILDRHMSQFYLSADIATSLPHRALRTAAAHGRSMQQGWRRGQGGTIFWGTTIIDAMLLGDGRVQGFSHVTHRSGDPSETFHAIEPKSATRSGVNAGALGLRRQELPS